MFCYAVWYPLQLIDLANLNPNREWLGSLCYLPHGARVLMFCFFRYQSLPGLYLAEVSGPSIINNENYMTCLLYTSPSPRDRTRSRMPSSA